MFSAEAAITVKQNREGDIFSMKGDRALYYDGAKTSDS